MNDISLTLKSFNDKIRLMNQTQKKELTLSAAEARNLHTEIFSLLAQIAELSKQVPEPVAEISEIKMDGGGF